MTESDNYIADSILLVITHTTCENCNSKVTSAEPYTILRPVSSEKRGAVRQLITSAFHFDNSLPRGRSVLRKTTFTCEECFDTYRADDKAERSFNIDHSPSALARWNRSLKKLEREQRADTRHKIIRDMVKSTPTLNLDDFLITPRKPETEN